MKPIRFLGDALKCLKEFPPDAQQDGGYQLDKVQRGQQPDDFKPMPAIGTGHVATAHRNRTTPLSTMHQRSKHEPPGRSQGEYRSAQRAEVYPMTTTTYASVWDAIADTPEQAANLRTRAELMQKIAAIVQANGWTQTQAATHCGITQPRMNDLLRGRVSRFSLDALVNIATAIGRRVHVELTLV